MNKKVLIVVVILLLLLLGGGAMVMMNKSKTAPANGTAMTANPTETTTTNTQLQGTLKSLLDGTVPQSCSFSTKNAANTRGKVFVSGGKMRGEFTSTVQDKVTTGHMIIDSGYTYIWTDTMKQGFKFALTEQEKAGTTTGNQAVNMNQNVSYTCGAWIPDAGMFTLPTDVTFSAFTIPTGAMTTGTSTNGSVAPSACSACDSVPEGPARTACKTQLNCK